MLAQWTFLHSNVFLCVCVCVCVRACVAVLVYVKQGQHIWERSAYERRWGTREGWRYLDTMEVQQAWSVLCGRDMAETSLGSEERKELQVKELLMEGIQPQHT